MHYVNKNTEKLVRPFETQHLAGGYLFAFGNIVHDCPYEAQYENVFSWEEFHLHYKCRSKGYNLYAPNKVLVYHNYSRTTRP